MKLHQQGTIYSLYNQDFPVVLDLDTTDDGHLSGFVNFYGNGRPEGFPLDNKFRIITDDPRASLVREILHLTVRFVHAQTAQVQGYIEGSRAHFQNVNAVADVQAELDYRFAKMAIDIAMQSTVEDEKPHPKVGAVAVKHGQLLGKACRAALEKNGRKSGQHAEFLLASTLSGGDLEGATIYTTLEPCLNRNEPKVSCVDRLISVKVARVVIGSLDPDHRGNGLRKLVHSPSIEVAFFPASLREEARELIREWKQFSERQEEKTSKNVDVRDWTGEWDLSEKDFRKFERSDVFAERFDENWLVRSDSSSKARTEVETACEMAGSRLLRSPGIHLSAKVKDQKHHWMRWLYYLEETEGFTRIVNSNHGGYIESLAHVSALACKKCGAKTL